MLPALHAAQLKEQDLVFWRATEAQKCPLSYDLTWPSLEMEEGLEWGSSPSTHEPYLLTWGAFVLCVPLDGLHPCAWDWFCFLVAVQSEHAAFLKAPPAEAAVAANTTNGILNFCCWLELLALTMSGKGPCRKRSENQEEGNRFENGASEQGTRCVWRQSQRINILNRYIMWPLV